MSYHKFQNAANYEFVSVSSKPRTFRTSRGKFRFHLRSGADEVHHVQVTGPAWTKNESQHRLNFIPRASRKFPRSSVTVNARGAFEVKSPTGEILLRSAPARFFGQCGEAAIFEFIREEGDHFYGLGEKWLGLEHSGRTTKFWNTNVWADFHPESVVRGVRPPDPVYASIPYLILRRRGHYIGMLLDNPGMTFISTGLMVSIAGQLELGESRSKIILGSERGQPSLYVIVGRDLPDLTRKFQQLVGPTPRPPAWALGYHQCRWGYKSEEDLHLLDKKFREHGIPVDGLWLDIDYMKDYKVFTLDRALLPAPRKTFAALARAGRKVVPIIDPGVKRAPGYRIYEEGRAHDVFCRNPQGQDYVGIAWPGETVFPDYSLEKTRRWWADEVARLASLGLHGAWLDMNDPATGPVDNREMLFAGGRKLHDTYHNQYAYGMAQASHAGFLQAHPQQRPFLLSRSGSTGIQQYSALWTGDNYSNYVHLRASIPTTLNLGLSGVPFNGPDIGGFGGDTTPELLRDWMKACFLFPFCRNHTFRDSRAQEPWAFGAKMLKTLKRYIQLRYRLRPYLYQLFIAHEKTGEAILRPLLYDFDGQTSLSIDRVDDQFMVGAHVLQAPFLQENQTERPVQLPGQDAWYDVWSDRWLKGEQIRSVRATVEETPLFIRDRSVLPFALDGGADAAFDARHVEFACFFSRDGLATLDYVIDDGISFAYQRRQETTLQLAISRRGDELTITSETTGPAFDASAIAFSTDLAITRVEWNQRSLRKDARPSTPFGPKRALWIQP